MPGPGGVPAQGGSAPGGGAWSGVVCSQGGLLWGVPGPGGRGCLLQGVPGGDPPPDGYCCERYASYWNAFLLVSCLMLAITL